MSVKQLQLILLSFTLSCFVCYSQMAQKPSGNYTQEKNAVKSSTASISFVKNATDFNQLARVYNKGTVNEIPHLLFMIDRKDSNKVYYINTPMYEFHLYFINALLGQNYTSDDIAANYKDEKRRFILGTISYQKLIKAYTYEYWEGDAITSELLKTTQKAINQSFNDTIILKTNSTQHEEVAIYSKIEYISQYRLIKEQPYIALNIGSAKGRVKILESTEDLSDVDENTILVLKEVPISIPPVAGIITDKASTLLSHVNILAKALKIPNAYIRDASTEIKKYEGKYIELKVSVNEYKIKEIEEPKFFKSKQIQYSIKSNIKNNELKPLDKIREKDFIYYGYKAANLGEVKAKLKNVVVPDGFSIPYAQFYNFKKQNRIAEKLEEIQSIHGFYEQPELRKKELEKLQGQIESLKLDTAMVNTWVRQWENQLQGKGVFVRSSSNAEDLKNFTGAGLFTTVPNVTNAIDLENAVKKVWASVYNFEAYEFRRSAGIPDSLIMMSVLVQIAINSDVSGVMITKDPYNPIRWDIVYIAAKRGIGIKVVEGKRIAEQVMYSIRNKAVQLITRSEENSELRFNEDGGLKEIPIKTEPQARVMPDALVGRLAVLGTRIKQIFNENMDIEWAVANNQIFILQARPYK